MKKSREIIKKHKEDKASTVAKLNEEKQALIQEMCDQQTEVITTAQVRQIHRKLVLAGRYKGKKYVLKNTITLCRQSNWQNVYHFIIMKKKLLSVCIYLILLELKAIIFNSQQR